MQECDISVGHLYKWALRVVERCVLSAAPSQPKGEKKHHDTIRDMMAASSHVLSSGTSAASLSESSCLPHESRTNIIVRMDLRSLVELAHGSAGRVNMREELDRPRRPPTGGV
jgi:2-methylaconitate cis-trans-isomerase PrpF